LGAFCNEAGNLCLRKTVWWAREDSNLQPSGYERATLPGKVNDYWRFQAGPAAFVRIWLPRFIGHLLVGGSSPPNWRTQSMSNRSLQQNSLLTGKLTGKIAKLGLT